MKKSLNNLGLLLSFLGILLIAIQPIRQLTGAVVSNSLISPNLNFFIGLLLSIIGILIFESGKNERLEDVTEAETQRLGIQEPELSQSQQDYINKYTPDYLKDYSPGLIYKLVRLLGRATLRRVEGKDKLPEGAKLFIMNHRVPYSEFMNLSASLAETVHPFVGANVGWNYTPWLAKKIGAIQIKSTNANLSKEQKEELLKRVSFFYRDLYKKEFDMEEKGNRYASNASPIRTMASMLLQGRAGVILAEGPATQVNDKLERAYAGYALVAREYKKRTGKSLPIVPVGARNGRVAFGEPFYIDEKGKQSKEELEKLATKRIRSLYDSIRQ